MPTYIPSANIPDGSITTNKLANNAVTREKIATNALDFAKIGSNTLSSNSQTLTVSVSGYSAYYAVFKAKNASSITDTFSVCINNTITASNYHVKRTYKESGSTVTCAYGNNSTFITANPGEWFHGYILAMNSNDVADQRPRFFGRGVCHSTYYAYEADGCYNVSTTITSVGLCITSASRLSAGSKITVYGIVG